MEDEEEEKLERRKVKEECRRGFKEKIDKK